MNRGEAETERRSHLHLQCKFPRVIQFQQPYLSTATPLQGLRYQCFNRRWRRGVFPPFFHPTGMWSLLYTLIQMSLIERHLPVCPFTSVLLWVLAQVAQASLDRASSSSTLQSVHLSLWPIRERLSLANSRSLSHTSVVRQSRASSYRLSVKASKSTNFTITDKKIVCLLCWQKSIESASE